jgi:hypothetical protein
VYKRLDLFLLLLLVIYLFILFFLKLIIIIIIFIRSSIKDAHWSKSIIKNGLFLLSSHTLSLSFFFFSFFFSRWSFKKNILYNRRDEGRKTKIIIQWINERTNVYNVILLIRRRRWELYVMLYVYVCVCVCLCILQYFTL